MIELLAENNFGDTRTGGLAGPTGLVIILLLVVGTILLIRNMNARLRRLPERFERPGPADRASAGRADDPPADQTGDRPADQNSGPAIDQTSGPAIDRSAEPR